LITFRTVANTGLIRLCDVRQALAIPIEGDQARSTSLTLRKEHGLLDLIPGQGEHLFHASRQHGRKLDELAHGHIRWVLVPADKLKVRCWPKNGPTAWILPWVFKLGRLALRVGRVEALQLSHIGSQPKHRGRLFQLFAQHLIIAQQEHE
jgi:hypothetical protein